MTVLILSLLLVAAVLNDGYSHKIPNILTGPGLLAGLILSIAAPLDSIGPMQSVLGVALGFAILLPGYVLGKMGAGDVKLMAMCGSFLGPYSIVNAGVLTLIAGGVLACVWLLVQKLSRSGEPQAMLITANGSAMDVEVGATSSKSKQAQSAWKQRFPYALAIAIGCYSVVFTNFSLFTN